MAEVNFNTAVEMNIVVRRNDSIDQVYEITNKDGSIYDLTDFTSFKMQVKTNSDAVASVLEFVSPVSIVVDTGLGTLQLVLDKTATDVTPSTYVYDLEGESALGRKTFMYGKFTIEPDITR